MNLRFSLKGPLCVLLLALSLTFVANAQNMDGIERARMKAMLKMIKDDIKKSYYDASFHGIDLEEKFKKSEDRLGQVQTTPEALGVIAQTLIDFNDSHLYFIPPIRNIAVEYGWRIYAIGDKTYVTAVKPGSDASKQGLKVGDQVVAINGFRPARSELWKMLYYYNAISKHSRMALDVLSPGDSEPHRVEISSEVKTKPQKITFETYFRLDNDFDYIENYKHRFFTVGPINIWRMPDFELDPGDVDSAVGHLEKHAPLILDLRGNGGGYVKALEELAGYFSDKDVQIAQLKGRKAMDPMLAKTHGKDLLTGKVVVLVDSRSASAAEILARLLQIQGRGIVIGDRSAGAVMQAQSFSEHMGTDSVIPFGVSVTNADVIMSDGKSLEHEGVVPDELIIPTAADLAAGRDPVLARAVEILGGKIDPAEAGKMSQFYWK